MRGAARDPDEHLDRRRKHGDVRKRREGEERDGERTRKVLEDPRRAELKDQREHEDRNDDRESRDEPDHRTSSPVPTVTFPGYSKRRFLPERSTRKFPRTSTSMSVCEKQLIASSGVHTMGSPRTLKDVFTITGVPVMSPYRSISR